MNLFDLYAKISLDTSDYEKGINSTKKSMSEYKKDVMQLAQTYKKQGMDMSAAMKKAYADIDKSQYETADNARKAAGKLSREWENVGKGISAKTIAMGHLMADAIKGAGRAIANFGKIGVQYNAQMESYTTNFKVMLGSTEAAVAKVEELKKMAEKTPFGMSELAEATQTLLAFQVPAEKSTDILQMLGDVALGDKEKLKGLAVVFGQVSSAGKLQGQDLMQLINQGFNPLNYISKRTGESMEELRKRMSDGAISAQEVEQAFIDATSEGGQFHNGMLEASTTMTGLVSTLQDVINSKLGEFFSNVSNKIAEMLPNVIAFVENIDTEKVKNKLKELLNTFAKLTPVIAGATIATVAYKSAVAIAGVIDALRKATEGQTIAQAALNAVMNLNPFVKIATIIGLVVTALVALWNTNEGFRNAVTEIWAGITAVFSSAWAGIKTVWDTVAPYFSAIWEAIKTVFSVVGEVLGQFFLGAWQTIEIIWNAAIPFFILIWEGIKTVFSVVGEVLGFYFSTALETIKLIWNTAVSFFQTIWNTIANIFSVVEAVLSGDFKRAWEGIKKIFADWADFFSGLWDAVKNAFSNVVHFFTDMGSNIVNSIKQGIANAWDGLVNWFNGIWDSLFGNRSVEVSANGQTRSIAVDGSHKNGLNYVPFDGYIAELHKGERVLTADEADNYNKNRGISIIQNIYSEAKTAADLMQEALYQQERAVLLGV